MQIVLHPGMPKSGSTSIQISINNNKDKLLDEAGFLYQVSDQYHNSHASLYHMAMNEDWNALRTYILNMIDDADRVGAGKILLSAERLFLVAGHPKIFHRFINEMRDHSEGNFRVALVVRSIKSYIVSYVTQLINNGSMFLDDTRLAAWTIDLVKTFWSLPDPVTVVSFDDAVSKNVLVDRFCIAIGCEGIRIPESNANATPRRTHEFSASLGVACKLMSLSRDIDINSEEIDIERQNAEDKFDLLRSKRAKYMDENVNEDFLDELIENSFNEYVEKCIECIPREDKYFYNDIVDSPMSWNYPKSMGGSGLRSIDNHMLKAQTIIS